MKSITFKLTKESNLVRKLFVLKNVVILPILEMLCKFHMQKTASKDITNM